MCGRRIFVSLFALALLVPALVLAEEAPESQELLEPQPREAVEPSLLTPACGAGNAAVGPEGGAAAAGLSLFGMDPIATSGSCDDYACLDDDSGCGGCPQGTVCAVPTYWSSVYNTCCICGGATCVTACGGSANSCRFCPVY